MMITTTRCLRLMTKPVLFREKTRRHMSSLPVQLHLHFWDRMKMESYEDIYSKTSKRSHVTGSVTYSHPTNGIPAEMSSEQIQMEQQPSGSENQQLKTLSSRISSLIIYKPNQTAVVSSEVSMKTNKSLLCIGSKNEK